MAVRARTRAVLSQHAEPAFPLSVEEVVEMGRYPHARHASRRRDREAVERALREIGMFEFRARAFGTLSAGERQKVQMARVLAQLDTDTSGEERLLFLDEPTSNLDVHHQLQLLTLARGLCAGGVTVIAVLHDLNLAGEFADHLLLLDRGRVVHASPRDPGLPADRVAAVYQVQARRLADPTGGSVWRFGL